VGASPFTFLFKGTTSLSVLCKVFAKAYESKTIEDDKEVCARLIERSDPDVDLSGGGECEAYNSQDKTCADVLRDDATGSTGDFQEERNVPQVVVHQRNACRVRGNITARESHCDADVRSGKDWTVIDAISNNKCSMTAGNQVLEFSVFLFG
jgi:hypothetical protein